MEVSKLDLGSLKEKVSKALGAQGEKSKKQRKVKEKKAKPEKKEYKKEPKQGKKDRHDKKSVKKDKSAEKKSESKSAEKPVEKPVKKTENKDNDLIRETAKELGATNDDVKLVEGVSDGESDQEFHDAKGDASLQGDVLEFMKGLDFGHGGDKAEKKAEKKESKTEKTEVKKREKREKKKKHEKEIEVKELVEEDEEEAGDDSGPYRQAKEEKPHKEKSKQLSGEDLKTVKSSRLSIPAQNDWYNIPLDLKSTIPSRLSQLEIDELYERAAHIVNRENDSYYEELNKSSSQRRFLSHVLSDGTLSDKISALTLLVQEAPLHNIKALDTLLAMCRKKSRSAAMQCVDACADLFENGIIPDDRKLKYFKKQPLQKDMTDLQLAVFYFEDYLKKWYFEYVGMLERLSHDSISFVRTKVVGHIFDLLKAKPEQEANLLRLGVNKIGDIDNQVSSKASYSILQLEQKHPAMKAIVVEAVIDAMFREKNEKHAIYYSAVTLNQTILSSKEDKLANKLVNAYFAMFEKLLVETDSENVSKLKESEHNKEGRHKRRAKKGKHGGKSEKKVEKSEQELAEERNSKTFSAILTGLNRAFPFSDLPSDVFESHLSTLYKITHGSNFNTSVQALLLLQKVVSKQTEPAKVDRYYRTLYESLLDDRLLTSSKQAIYLNLLFKSLKQDTNKTRVQAFVKRICQICLGWLNIGTISGMLFLLIQLAREISEIRNLFYNIPGEDDKPEETYDPRKRDPKFAHAENASLWEIEFFLHYYHPTVQLYGNSLIDGAKVGKPDLGLFTLSHFLDRFVYKKPKKNVGTRGHSIMQPLGGAQTGNLLVRASDLQELQQLPANTQEWMSRKAENVRPEDRFFYEYFSTKQEKEERSKYDKGIDKSGKEAFDEEGELDEDEVWQALIASNPEAEAGEGDLLDDEVDLSMSDFEAGDFDDNDDDEEEAEIDLEGEDEDDEELEGLVEGDEIENGQDGEVQEDNFEVEPAADENDSDSSLDDDIKEMIEGEDESSSEEEEEEEAEESSESDSSSNKRKNPQQGGKKKRFKMSSLPLFASPDEVEALLEKKNSAQ